MRSARNILSFVVSFLIVAAAQPDWSIVACILAASIGYALFWSSTIGIVSKTKRLLLSVLWFGSIQLVHLSWFTHDHYVGGYIFVFLTLLCLFLGFQFGFTSLLVPDPRQLTLVRILGISGLWALMEWSRLFILSGFPWNPTGLSLSGTLYGMQLVSVVGVYGLSFWVFFTNLFALKFMASPAGGSGGMWGILVLIPYFFGGAQVLFHNNQMKKDPRYLNVLLVQTSIYPEEKMPLNGSKAIPPNLQWEKILSLLSAHKGKPIDMILFSESAVPYGTSYPIYSKEYVLNAFEQYLNSMEHLPVVEEQAVGNQFWAQGLANSFESDVIIGLEDAEAREDGSFLAYNSAFLFRPFFPYPRRYEKRVLVPLGEYIPFDWCRNFLLQYGINDFFTPGEADKVFPCETTFAGVSICYEEVYGNMMRENRIHGANLLVNLSNDVWYPRSRLPIVHFMHGRLRGVENGIPALRSCNTGVTCAIDSLGRVVSMLDYETDTRDSPTDVMFTTLPLYHYGTFYSYYGDAPTIYFSLGSFCFMSLLAFLKRKRFMINELDISPLRKN